MQHKILKYKMTTFLIILLMIEWFSVFFASGALRVVAWWAIWWGSFIGLIIFALYTVTIIIRLIKHRKIHYSLFTTMFISLIMIYPICWFFGIGQMAYPAKVNSLQPGVSIRLPINEATTVGWGGESLETNRPHAMVPMERWGYDLLVAPFSIKSDKLRDYGIYDKEVIAPASGTIVEAYDGEDDIVPGSENNKTMAGNHIYIKLDKTKTYLVIAHLKKGSILVKKGQHVEEGTVIARAGNSGSTSEPHLHIHHQRQNPASTSIFLAEGLPLYFRDINGPAMPKGGSVREVISPNK